MHGKVIFIPGSSPTEEDPPETFRGHPCFRRCRVKHPKISAFLGEDLQLLVNPKYLRLIEVTQEEGKAWREKPLSKEHDAVFLGVGPFPSVR